MAHIDLNVPLIRESKGKEFVLYLNTLQQNQLHIDICQSLFEAVDHEHLPASIFSVFLPWSLSPDTIVLCMRHGPSCSIRKQGIKQFGKALADPERWESAWKAVGGTEGLIELFAKISVREVEALARAIGYCNHHQRKVSAREKSIEELLQALVPLHRPGSKLHGRDKRPIQNHFAQLVPACSPEFVEQLVNPGNRLNTLYQRAPVKPLIMTHGDMLQKHIMKDVFGGGYKDEHLEQYLEGFAYNQPQKPGPEPRVSASMDFAIKVLKLRLEDIDNDKAWPSGTSEAGILSSVLQRSLKRRLPEARLRDIILLGLRILEAKPKSRPEFESMDIWSTLITRWQKAPNLYVRSLALALRLKLGGSHRHIGEKYFATLQTKKIKPELRWLLLRLYCLHVPEKGIDLDTTNDFTPLANQPWPCEIFYLLSKDQAVKLLEGLYNANPKYSFLQRQRKASILRTQNIVSQQNFNVVILLTVLQCSSKESQKRTERAIHELQQKAAAASDRLERAQLVKAVSDFAIASGSLDLYSKTVTWQQRYIRDPPTFKAVIERDTVLTSEGIELLSGIPQPLPEGITLAEIKSSVGKANGILMSFHNAKQIAEQEPSFYRPDWVHVASLFGSAINERVTRAKDLQRHLQGQEADLYKAVWSSTLAMLEAVNLDFIQQALRSIENLISSLPLRALAATAQAMLEAGNKIPRDRDRNSADRGLERLSYKAIIRLAKSNKPELAQPFILQTVTDRPEAGSWHRRLLSVSFLKSLSAKDAHDMLLTFATAIREKLEEQSYTKISKTQTPLSGEAKPVLSTESKPLVRVTTVKYLAQLFDNAEFISADTAIGVLMELFRAKIHRDIRLATLDSLLSLLNNLCSKTDNKWRSNAAIDNIMGALEEVIPIAGSLNELYPPGPEDWEEARKTGKLPLPTDIPDGLVDSVSKGLPPLMNAVVTASNAQQYPGLKQLQAEFVARYLLPILSHSQAEHRRWIALFLTKHKATFTADELPPIPLTWLLWAALVEKYPNLIPETVFEDFNKYIVMTIVPYPALKDFNASLKTNTNLSNTTEVRHWLSVFGKHITSYKSSGTQMLVRMIHHSQPISSVHNGITFGKILDMVISHASLFLAKYEKYIDVWNDFVNDLHPPTKDTYPGEDADTICTMASVWQKSGRLILEKVITLVSDRKEKNTLEHKRSVLPSTMKLRLWLLPYPSFPYTAEFRSECKLFIKELVELLSTFLQGETNALRWPEITKDAFTIAGLLHSPKERLRVALDIGTIPDPSDGEAENPRSPALKYVRVGLAMQLMEMEKEALRSFDRDTSSEQGIGPALYLKKMVEEWQDDPDEGVREKVWEWKREDRKLWRDITDTEWNTSRE